MSNIIEYLTAICFDYMLSIISATVRIGDAEAVNVDSSSGTISSGATRVNAGVAFEQ